jgi:monothiol glutaredoxin
MTIVLKPHYLFNKSIIMSSKTEETIRKQLAENTIILYMKGIPTKPECGFSAKTVEILTTLKIPFTYVNVLQAPFIREKLPKLSHWPTFPQLFVNAELVGGCDIVSEMYASGSLQPLLQSALAQEKEKSSPKDNSLSPETVKGLIQASINDAEIFIEGAGCDLTITVISQQFTELSLVKKQQLVLMSLTEPLADGRLHAVSVKAYTPNEWQDKQNATGLLQIKM